TVRCRMRNSSSTSGILARGKLNICAASRLPQEDLDVVEPPQVDDGVDLDLLLEGGRRHLGRPHPADGETGRKHAALEAAGHHDLTGVDLRAHVDQVDWESLVGAVAPGH